MATQMLIFLTEAEPVWNKEKGEAERVSVRSCDELTGGAAARPCSCEAALPRGRVQGLVRAPSPSRSCRLHGGAVPLGPAGAHSGAGGMARGLCVPSLPYGLAAVPAVLIQPPAVAWCAARAGNGAARTSAFGDCRAGGILKRWSGVEKSSDMPQAAVERRAKEGLGAGGEEARLSLKYMLYVCTYVWAPDPCDKARPSCQTPPLLITQWTFRSHSMQNCWDQKEIHMNHLKPCKKWIKIILAAHAESKQILGKCPGCIVYLMVNKDLTLRIISLFPGMCRGHVIAIISYLEIDT